MRNRLLMMTVTLAVGFLTNAASAGHPVSPYHRVHADRAAYWHNTNMSWHGQYNHVQYGRPLALIVPPTAAFQTEYSWGVGRTQMRPLNHQFGRPIATPGGGGTMGRTPAWPSSTQQLGVYSVRGPW